METQPATSKPKRRWLQFGLRTLFVLVTAAAIGLGIWGHFAERQRRAVTAVWDLGGDVRYDDDPRSVSEHFNRAKSGSFRAWMHEYLGHDYVSSVVAVRLEDTHVTGTGLEHLKRQTSLEFLVLKNTQVSDAQLAELRAALPDCRIERSRPAVRPRAGRPSR